MNEAHSPRTATYYVVPLAVPRGQSTENCLYFQKTGKGWERVGPDDLNSRNSKQDIQSDFVCLIQATKADVEEIMGDLYTGLPRPLIDWSAKLFAAVAKTMHVNAYLSTVFVAQEQDKGRLMVLPVASSTQRGVILVFSNKDGLIASSDPEIKNS